MCTQNRRAPGHPLGHGCMNRTGIGNPPSSVHTIHTGTGTPAHTPTTRGRPGPAPASRWPRVHQPDRPREPSIPSPSTGIPTTTRARTGTGPPPPMCTPYRLAPGHHQPPPPATRGRTGSVPVPLVPGSEGGLPHPVPAARCPVPAHHGPAPVGRRRPGGARRRSAAAEPARFRRHLQAASGTGACPVTPPRSPFIENHRFGQKKKETQHKMG